MGKLWENSGKLWENYLDTLYEGDRGEYNKNNFNDLSNDESEEYKQDEGIDSGDDNNRDNDEIDVFWS